MDAGLLIGLEMAAVLGLVVVWGGYELWSLRRYRQRDEAEKAERARAEQAANDR